LQTRYKKSELSSVKDIVFSAFEQMEEQLDCRIPKSFFLIIMLFLSIKGRINFLQLERFSGFCEQRFRYFFERSFDFFSFNKVLIHKQINGKTALAFDPSFISKAGKKTPGVGYFWSGCAGKTKWGLEFCGLAVLDLTRKTAFHLFGFQTVDLQDDEKLITFYVRKIMEKKEDLLKISKYLVADAYFSKITFVKPFVDAGFHVISRLRDDADLQYIFLGEQKKGKGRPQKYDGKIDFKKLNKKHAKLVSEVENEKIYSLIVHSKSLKMNVNLVIVYTKNSKNIWSHKIYFSTNLEQNWEEILEMYRLRFQIEFLYRDAKQFTGLNHCEARSRNKLNFHWEMSLTAINLAKIAHWIPKKDEKPKQEVVFSMSDIKTQYYNELLMNQFISMFGINPELEKNKRKIKKFLDFGKIAA
jgi:predicted transcriptional regulator